MDEPWSYPAATAFLPGSAVEPSIEVTCCRASFGSVIPLQLEPGRGSCRITRNRVSRIAFGYCLRTCTTPVMNGCTVQ